MIRKQQLGDIIQITNRMLTLADAGAWEDLPDLQTERETLISTFFEAKVNPNEIGWVEAGLRELLELERTIVQKTNSQFQVVSAHLQKLRDGKKANLAYEKNK